MYIFATYIFLPILLNVHIIKYVHNVWFYVYIDMCKLQSFCFLFFISGWTFRPRQLQMDLSGAERWESGQDVGSFARLLHHFGLAAKVLPLHALALFLGALVCCWVQKGVHWVHPCCSRFTDMDAAWKPESAHFGTAQTSQTGHTAMCHTMLVVLGAVHVASSYTCAKLYDVVRVVVDSCTAQGSRLPS